jgi:uncharacterized protein (TIGR02266 family)
MSKNSKKQRAKAQKAQVRRASGTVLRAVTPPSAGGKLLELKRPPAESLPPDAPDAAEASRTPAALARDDVPVTDEARRGAIIPTKLTADDVESASTVDAAQAREVDASNTDVSPAAPVEEHRASPRVSLAVDIHLSSDSHFFSGLSGDISEGGVFLSTYRALTVGTQVDVEFSLPGTERRIHARGEVRWIREHSAEQPRGVGIAFEDLAAEDREEIHAFCSSRPPLYYDVD